MEIRLLQEEELKVASGLARYVFDTCVRERMEFEQTAAYIEEYLSWEHLLEMVQNGQLFLWGGFEDNEPVAVSAMEANGLITMLYVLPHAQGKKCGTKMLQTMRDYAKEELQLEDVTVNVTPVWREKYFRERGFRYIQKPENMHVPYVSMIAPTQNKEEYPTKHVPGWVFLIIGGVILTVSTVLCVLSAVIYGLQL